MFHLIYQTFIRLTENYLRIWCRYISNYKWTNDTFLNQFIHCSSSKYFRIYTGISKNCLWNRILFTKFSICVEATNRIFMFLALTISNSLSRNWYLLKSDFTLINLTFFITSNRSSYKNGTIGLSTTKVIRNGFNVTKIAWKTKFCNTKLIYDSHVKNFKASTVWLSWLTQF